LFKKTFYEDIFFLSGPQMAFRVFAHDAAGVRLQPGGKRHSMHYKDGRKISPLFLSLPAV
jgi:hypothetical protein